MASKFSDNQILLAITAAALCYYQGGEILTAVYNELTTARQKTSFDAIADGMNAAAKDKKYNGEARKPAPYWAFEG